MTDLILFYNTTIELQSMCCWYIEILIIFYNVMIFFMGGFNLSINRLPIQCVNLSWVCILFFTFDEKVNLSSELGWTIKLYLLSLVLLNTPAVSCYLNYLFLSKFLPCPFFPSDFFNLDFFWIIWSLWQLWWNSCS